MNSLKLAVILYFVDGPAPSPDDMLAAQQLGGEVRFRNARAVDPNSERLEVCDGVAGAVPSNYASAYKTAEEAVSAQKQALEKLASKVGDTPAPKLDQGSGKGEGDAKLPDPTKPAVNEPNGGPAWNKQS